MWPFPPSPGRRPEASVMRRYAVLDATVPWLVGFMVFVFRLTSLRDLTNDHYMHLSWAQQTLFGLLPGRDFVDPGMPLAWGLSALVQAVARGPFAEAAFSSAMFGLTAAVTCVVTTRVTGSLWAGAVSALIGAAFLPRLYNYPKLLVPALTLALLHRYVERRTTGRLAALAAGVGAGVLFRHDLGLYAAIVSATGVAIAHRDSLKAGMRTVLLLAGLTAAWLAPYVAYVAWSEGLIEHVRRGLEFSRGEQSQLQYDWPTFPSLASASSVPWSATDATALLYYASWLLPLAALACVPWKARPGAHDRLPLALGALLFLALYLPIILRYPLNQRLPDIASPLVVTGALVACSMLGVFWRMLASRASAATHVGRPFTGRLVPAAIAYSGILAVLGAIALVAVNAGYVGGFAREMEDTRIERGIPGLVSKVRSLYEDGATWPWERFWPNSGDFPVAVRYLSTCTLPGAYVLMTWPSPEYYFFSQRRFAAGHSMFLPPAAFTTERDQQFMLARLTQERPPIALVNRTTIAAFERAYPRVHTYIVNNYTDAATYRHYDDSTIAIAVRNDLRASSYYGTEGWPCGLVTNRTDAAR